MTREQYLAAYARRHQLDIEQLRKSVVVVECTCRLSGCHGWAIDWTAPIAPHEDVDG